MHRSRGMRTRRALLVGLCAALAVAASSIASADDTAKPLRFSKAKILFEVNETDNDAGIQLFLDAEGWERVTVYAPDGGGKLMDIRARGSVAQLGLTELFFESEEPSLDELPLEELLAMFPEGRYRIVGTTAEGRDIVGSAVLSHDIPVGPSVVAPTEGAIVDPAALVIDWDPVVEPAGIQIRGYQVIVELADPSRTFSVDLPASVTAVTVPAEFLEAGATYKFEVLAVARNGNQTITESMFTTAP